MSEIETPKPNAPSKIMHYGMIVCCTVMLIPVAGFFIAGGSVAGLWSNASVFAPIVLCIGAHAVMFKLMGKSCHSSKTKDVETAVVEIQTSRVPIVERSVG